MINNRFITFHFYKYRYPIWDPRYYTTFLIGYKTNSILKHCSIQIEGDIYESKAFYGVVRSRTLDRKDKDIVSLRIPVTEKQIIRLKKFYFSQLGKGYDYLAIFGFAFSQNIHSINRWFCSELANYALHIIRPDIFLYYPECQIKLVSPKDLYNRVLFLLSGINTNISKR